MGAKRGRDGCVGWVFNDMDVRSRLPIRFGVMVLAMPFRRGTTRYNGSTRVGIAATPGTSEDRGWRYSGGRKVTRGSSRDSDALKYVADRRNASA